MTGLQHIHDTFAAARVEGRAALMPYYTLGFPNPGNSLAILEAIAGAGADLIELGVPFSDPLADGPTIQRSTQVALEQGMSVRGCLEQTAQLRARGVAQPLLLMGYYNPLLAYGGAAGIERFVADAEAAGAGGLIVPDLPVEEAGELESVCQVHQMALVYLLAPTSPPARVAQVAARTRGFLYLVSLTGVTGARKTLPDDLAAFIERVRSATATPLAVGFGIGGPEQARAVGRLADGVIVGSALINAVTSANDPCAAAFAFVRDLRQALG